MLTGDRKTAYQREYMRRRRAAGNGGQPTRATEPSPELAARIVELEAEVERLRKAKSAARAAKLEAEIEGLKAQVERLSAMLRQAGERNRAKAGYDWAKAKQEAEERRAQTRAARQQEKAAQKAAEAQAAAAAVEARASPEASPQALREAFCTELILKDAEIDKLTQLWARAKSEVRELKKKLEHAWAQKGGPPLPPQVVKMIAHLGNENEHERLAALKKIERVLKEHGLNWADVANHLN